MVNKIIEEQLRISVQNRLASIQTEYAHLAKNFTCFHKYHNTGSQSDLLKNIDGIGFAHLTSKDVVRHKLVREIIDAYEAES